MATTPTIFLSYSWANANIADEIDKDFQITGITLRRDVRDVVYKGNIKEFMKTITTHDYVVVLISNEFIRSANCMYEVMELFQHPDFKNKILPVIIPGTNIFQSKDRVEILKYWTNKKDETLSLLKEVNPIQASSVQEDLKHFTNICDNIDRFLTYIKDTNCLSLEKLKKEGYKSIFDLIGFDPKEAEKMETLLKIQEIEDEEEQSIEIEKYILNNPNDYIGWLIKGFIAVSKWKKYKLGKYAFERSLNINPQHDKTNYNYALVLKSQFDDIEGAKKHYKIALELNPQYAKAHNNYAYLLIDHFDDKEGAKNHYEKALDIDPQYAKAHNNYAFLLKEKFNDIENAKLHYLKAIGIDPSLKTPERDADFGI